MATQTDINPEFKKINQDKMATTRMDGHISLLANELGHPPNDRHNKKEEEFSQFSSKINDVMHVRKGTPFRP